MEYDTDKIDQTVMALLSLTMFNDGDGTRAWKGQDWEVMNRLFKRGWIGDPKSKAKSVVVTEEGERMATQLFDQLFAKSS